VTYRVYLRWPAQKISNRTSTESRTVAQGAFDELSADAQRYTEQGAIGIALTLDGKQLQYHELAEGNDERSPGAHKKPSGPPDAEQ
jgi:hypothetical protein